MNKSNYFKSTLAKFFQAFVDEYIAKGKDPHKPAQTLHGLDTYLVTVGYNKDHITKDVYDGWAETQDGLSPKTIYDRKCYVTSFCRYLCEIGHASYIGILPKVRKSNFIPYIFTEDEIKTIFEASDEGRDCKVLHNSHSMVMPALLRLLYSTGVRIGEALQLRNRDIDFSRHVISLHYTKNRVDRLAPINAELECVLKQYMHYRDLLPANDLDNPDGLFFVKPDGKQCNKCRITARFHKILAKAGIPSRPSTNMPRIHDLRHTACVHAFIKLIRGGRDPYCCLPILSSFMGHLTTESTEHYLRLTTDMYPDLISMDTSVTAPIKDVILKSLIEHGNKDL